MILFRKLSILLFVVGLTGFIISTAVFSIKFGPHTQPITNTEDFIYFVFRGFMYLSVLGFVIAETSIGLPLYKKYSPALKEVAKERNEQIKKHGRSIADDAVYNNKGQLPLAAMRLILGEDIAPIGWSGPLWDKMISKSYRERLKIASALLIAEIDRIDLDERI